MDYGAVANVSSNATSGSPSAPFVHEIVFLLFAIVAITADILIICTIMYFKRTRVAPYIYLANWAIADLCSIILLPWGIQLLSVLDQIGLPDHLHCAFTQSGILMHAATIQFVTLAAMDWVLAAYFPSASEKLRKWYKLVIGLIWTVVIIMDVEETTSCWISEAYSMIANMYMAIALTIAFLVVIVIQIMRLVQKIRKRSTERSGLIINMTTAYLGCWMLSSVINMLAFLIFYHPIIIVLSYCLMYSSSIINFFLMNFFNNDFNACVRQLLRCRRIRYEEDLVANASVQNNVTSNSISIDLSDAASLMHTENIRRL